MANNFESKLAEIPKTIDELFIANENFQPLKSPNIKRVLHAGRESGPLAMVLSAMGEVGVLTNDEEGQRNPTELKAILHDSKSTATPERISLLRAATKRRALATFVLNMAEDILDGDDYMKKDENGKSRLDLDKVGDLYDDTERFETSSHVLHFVREIRNIGDGGDEYNRVGAERLIRIVLSGQVDQTLEFLAAVEIEKERQQFALLSQPPIVPVE